MSRDINLGVAGFKYSDLYSPSRLADLTSAFHAHFRSQDAEGWAEWEAYRSSQGAGMAPPKVGAVICRASSQLSDFVARLFNIQGERTRSMAEHARHSPVLRFKKEFIVRRVLAKPPAPGGPPFGDLDADVTKIVGPAPDRELAVSTFVCELLDLELHLKPDAKHPRPPMADAAKRLAALRAKVGGDSDLAAVEGTLEKFARWGAGAHHEREHGHGFHDWISLKQPEAFDWPDGLVKFQRPDPALPNHITGPAGQLRRRDGFKLTDARWNLRESLDHAHYCVLCHEREKDSCSKGLPMPRKDKPLQKNPLGIGLAGCPLDERISEMHLMKRQGDTIAALAIVMIDNPMCPATGHRICNDCMKSCIYQKQEPVNIPQIETRALTDTLDLPWGVEIYGLLTRWNPINIQRPQTQPYNGKNVLVVGMGPAGFALSQYLMNEGFGIAGIDGLKIEPLPAELTGTDGDVPRPIKDAREILESLEERVSAGFGGVAEYGITVRWDKNFLKLIYLTLMRRPTFRVYGGVRFGGTLTAEDAWDLGFHHVAVASGAGRPTIVDMKNNLIPGIRKASDFLMALQLTGAFKKFAMANLQLRLPAVVIGGGLTGIDTATEALAYYPLQVEKILDRFEVIAREQGEEKIRASFNEEEKTILDEYLAHGRGVRAERARAAKAGEAPNFKPLTDAWGGVWLCYRKSMQDSPAYRLNHEEIIKFLEEGLNFVEGVDPREAIPDQYGSLSAIKFEKVKEVDGKWINTGEFLTRPARAVLVAAGTTPNIIYEKERPGTLQMDARKKFFAGFNIVDGKPVAAAQTPEDPGFFTSYAKDGKFMSYYGDNHPVYAGSVVKAIASAKDGAPVVTALFRDEIAKLAPAGQAGRDAAWKKLGAMLDDQLIVRVEDVKRLTPTIIEIIVKAPMQARKFEPGQFYRLQNFEVNSRMLEGTKLGMEGIALTGAWVDKPKGLLSMIALELGVSSRLCGLLKKGEQVIAMGPTGSPSEVGKGENVLLAGGGLGNAVLFSIARAMRDAGNKVVYFAGYKKPEDLFHREDIEAGCDMVIWSADVPPGVPAKRPQDRSFVGNIVQSMVAYGEGKYGEVPFPLSKANRILAIGSDRMMAAVKNARHGVLAPLLNPDHAAIASVNSPMQCMMKEVCAQCLQRHVDPKSGKEYFVFSCYNQDQPMDSLDWKNLNERLRQNTVQEKLSNYWLDHILAKHPMARV